jgi:rhodanese-related sulfurtransferase
LYVDFVIKNWYLFLGLVIVVALLLVDPVRRRAGGIEKVSIFELSRLVSHDNAAVVDVSDEKDYRNGHIKGALGAPMNQLDNHQPRLEKLRKRPIIVVCRTGSRAPRAAMRLRAMGFEKLYALDGGMVAWEKENLPVVK